MVNSAKQVDVINPESDELKGTDHRRLSVMVSVTLRGPVGPEIKHQSYVHTLCKSDIILFIYI